MTKWCRRKPKILGNQRGFTLVELMVVVAMIGILAAIGIQLYASSQSAARIAKAQADTHALASAVVLYSAMLGGIPTALTQLTATASNTDGITAGPWFAALPTPPLGWNPTPYGYLTAATGAFTVSAAGDSTTALAP